MFVDDTKTFWTDGVPITFHEIMDWYERYCAETQRDKRKIPDPHYSEKVCYQIAKILVNETYAKLGMKITNNYGSNEESVPSVRNTISTFVTDPETAGVDWFDQSSVMKCAMDSLEKKWKEKKAEEKRKQEEALKFWKTRQKTNSSQPPRQPTPPPFNWRKVLGFGLNEIVNEDTIKRYYRKEALRRHPDKGGSDALMFELFRARDCAYKFINKEPP